jgi:DNA-binding transcriptional LysR family regulator
VWRTGPAASNTESASRPRRRAWYRWGVSLVQLESFVAVAEEGHVGRAAKRLHVTQPPLTRRIRSLEDDLGVALFERTPRGMRLSTHGERLLDRARRILAEVAEARADLEPDARRHADPTRHPPRDRA